MSDIFQFNPKIVAALSRYTYLSESFLEFLKGSSDDSDKWRKLIAILFHLNETNGIDCISEIVEMFDAVKHDAAQGFLAWAAYSNTLDAVTKFVKSEKDLQDRLITLLGRVSEYGNLCRFVQALMAVSGSIATFMINVVFNDGAYVNPKLSAADVSTIAVQCWFYCNQIISGQECVGGIVAQVCGCAGMIAGFCAGYRWFRGPVGLIAGVAGGIIGGMSGVMLAKYLAENVFYTNPSKALEEANKFLGLAEGEDVYEEDLLYSLKLKQDQNKDDLETHMQRECFYRIIKGHMSKI